MRTFVIALVVLSGLIAGCSDSDDDSPGIMDPNLLEDSSYGSGYHGSLIVASETEINISSWSVTGAEGSDTLSSISPPMVATGQHLFVHQSRGDGAGNYEIRKVAGVSQVDVSGNCEIFLDEPLTNTYQTGGDNCAQALIVIELTDLTVETGGVLTAPAWNGLSGGLLVLLVNGSAVVQSGGLVSMTGTGYRGPAGSYGPGLQGEGHPGSGIASQASNGNGGGGGGWNPISGYAGGGGGHGSAGANATGQYFGFGGATCGDDLTSRLYFGGGGGGGAHASDGPSDAGDGGGLVYIAAASLLVEGGISCGGTGGASGGIYGGGGGGGAGGSIFLISDSCTLGADLVEAPGGSGIDGSGAGGVGRIAVQSPEPYGTTIPPFVQVP